MSPTLIGAIIAGVLVTGSIGWAKMERSGRQAAETQAARERDRADANAAVNERMRADAEQNSKIAADFAAENARLKEKERAIRDKIVAAGDDADSCSSSGAVRTLLDELRREGGAPDPAGAPPAR